MKFIHTYLILLTSILFVSCENGQRKEGLAQLRVWNKQATQLLDTRQQSNAQKALAILDSATAMYPFSDEAFNLKIRALQLLHNFERAVLANDTLLSISPSVASFWLGAGGYRDITGDSNCNYYYRRCVEVADSVVSDIYVSGRSKQYSENMMYKAIALKLKGEPVLGDSVLLESMEVCPDETLKDYLRMFVGMEREEILYRLFYKQ